MNTYSTEEDFDLLLNWDPDFGSESHLKTSEKYDTDFSQELVDLFDEKHNFTFEAKPLENIKLQENEKCCLSKKELDLQGHQLPTVTKKSRWSEWQDLLLIGVLTDVQLHIGNASNWGVITDAYNLASRRYSVIHDELVAVLRTAGSLKKRHRALFTDAEMKSTWHRRYNTEWQTNAFNANLRLLDSSDVVTLAGL